MQSCGLLLSQLLLLLTICSILIKTSCDARKNFSKFIRDDYSPYLSRNQRHQSHNRISGGYDAKVNEFPSFVSFVAKDSRNELVGVGNGVAINNRLVLTTASRVTDQDVKYSVATGIWHYNTWNERKIKTYEVERVCASKKFDEQKRTNDIAILKLTTTIENSLPAVLPTNPVQIGSRGTVVGIGFTDGGLTGTEPESLQALPVERVECNKRYNHPTLMCFQSYDPSHVGSACTEDGGGPVFGQTDEGRQVVLGLVSEYSREQCVRGKRIKNVYIDIFNLSKEIAKLAQDCQ